MILRSHSKFSLDSFKNPLFKKANLNFIEKKDYTLIHRNYHLFTITIRIVKSPTFNQSISILSKRNEYNQRKFQHRYYYIIPNRYSKQKRESGYSEDLDDLPDKLTLYYSEGKSHARLFSLLVLVFGGAMLLSTDFTWRYTLVKQDDSTYVRAPLWKRVLYSSLFIGSFLFACSARYMFSKRNIIKIDLLPNGRLELGFYDVLSRRTSEIIKLSDIKKDSLNTAGSHFSFRIKNRYLVYVVSKNGRISNEKALLMALEGKNPLPTWKK